jgi:dienelactone hydrolase
MLTRIKTWLALAGAAVVAVALAFFRGRSAGKKDAENEQARETIDRTEAGRDAVQDGRDSGLSPADRLRRNDGQL